MIYYIKCHSIFEDSDVHLKDSAGVIQYTFKRTRKSNFNGIKIYDETKHLRYQVKFNKLKLKHRYQLLDKAKQTALDINTGLKRLHYFDLHDQHYFVKGSFARIAYQVYDDRRVVAWLKVVKVGNERMFRIEILNGYDMKLVLGLYIIAQAVREWYWFS
jgi:uncharacterized protein YxjI